MRGAAQPPLRPARGVHLWPGCAPYTAAATAFVWMLSCAAAKQSYVQHKGSKIFVQMWKYSGSPCLFVFLWHYKVKFELR